MDHNSIRRKKNQATEKKEQNEIKKFPCCLLWKLTHRNNADQHCASQFCVWLISLAISISLNVKSHRNACISLMSKKILWRVCCWNCCCCLSTLFIFFSRFTFIYQIQPINIITESSIHCVFRRWFSERKKTDANKQTSPKKRIIKKRICESRTHKKRHRPPILYTHRTQYCLFDVCVCGWFFFL